MGRLCRRPETCETRRVDVLVWSRHKRFRPRRAKVDTRQHLSPRPRTRRKVALSRLQACAAWFLVLNGCAHYVLEHPERQLQRVGDAHLYGAVSGAPVTTVVLHPLPGDSDMAQMGRIEVSGGWATLFRLRTDPLVFRASFWLQRARYCKGVPRPRTPVKHYLGHQHGDAKPME